MRESCLNCAIKHLSQAYVLLEESVLGYPSHMFRAIGHMAEASSELVNKHPDLAMEIREHRKLLMDEPEYEIPFDTLFQECYERKSMLS